MDLVQGRGWNRIQLEGGTDTRKGVEQDPAEVWNWYKEGVEHDGVRGSTW